MTALVVTQPFDGYAVGDMITDPALVEALRGSPFVVPVKA